MSVIVPLFYVGISQSFISGLFLATQKSRPIPGRIMAAWQFLICCELLFALLNNAGYEMYSFPFISFTYGPLLYLYIKHLGKGVERFRSISLIHFIPFLVFFTVSVVFRTVPIFDDPSGFFVSDRFISLRIIYGLSFFISITAYSALSFLAVTRYQATLPHILSFRTGKVTLNWLKVLTVAFYLTYFTLFVMGGMNIIGAQVPFDPYYIVFFFITLFSFIFSFFSFRQPTLSGLPSNTANAPESEVRYARSGLKEKSALEILDKLNKAMEQDKIFLKSDLSVTDLSEITGVSRHHITQVLNEYRGSNFFTFINEYRTREVIRRMRDTKYSNYTILALAFDSGFNSKSTFNTVFKAITGLTPSDYREGI